MAGRPQNAPAGLFAKKEILIGPSGKQYFHDYSTTNALLSANTTGLKVYGGLALSNKTDMLTANTTALLLPKGLRVSGQATPTLTANTTALIATALRIGALTSYITVNTTGIRIGTRYISTNTTSNSVT